ncbi:hypothetical protein [Longimicrobium sp.]|jgi:hypothetical protein|uniref:hypothetical protein n=1 Tax=Longimicrobium sp. TaxID=2029185 RepID=UPI002F927653
MPEPTTPPDAGLTQAIVNTLSYWPAEPSEQPAHAILRCIEQEGYTLALSTPEAPADGEMPGMPPTYDVLAHAETALRRAAGTIQQAVGIAQDAGFDDCAGAAETATACTMNADRIRRQREAMHAAASRRPEAPGGERISDEVGGEPAR